MLAVDLGVFHRHAHAVLFRESLSWSLVWVTLAALFNDAVYAYASHQSALMSAPWCFARPSSHGIGAMQYGLMVLPFGVFLILTGT